MKLIKGNAIPVAVRELVVALALFGEVSVELDDVAHVNDHQEGRPAVILGDRASVIVGLVAGLEHGVVPGGGAAHAVPNALLFAFSGTLGQVALPVLLLVNALFGFQNEVARAVDVGKAGTAFVGVREGDGPLEPVVIVCVIVRRRERALEVEQLGQFDHEQLVVGVFTAARRFPTGDKFADLLFGGHLLVNQLSGQNAVFEKGFKGVGVEEPLACLDGFLQPLLQSCADAHHCNADGHPGHRRE